jgi:aminoacrylate hydrolase
VIFDVHEGPDAGAETILLSAGLGGTAGYWTPQLAALSRRYRLVTYDQAGTGRNRGQLPERHSIADMAEEALSVLDASGTARAHFVGHALGGLVGLELALSRAERLASLTVVNGWAAVSAHTRRCFEMRLALLEHEGPAAYVRAQPIFLYPADWLTRNSGRAAEEESHGLTHFQGADTLRKRIAALLSFDATSRLRRLRLPTLVVAARDDVLVPSTMSEDLAWSIEGSRLYVAPWGGHAINVTEPDAFNSMLVDFLEHKTNRQAA